MKMFQCSIDNIYANDFSHGALNFNSKVKSLKSIDELPWHFLSGVYLCEFNAEARVIE
jgi:hypothetical protein